MCWSSAGRTERPPMSVVFLWIPSSFTASSVIAGALWLTLFGAQETAFSHPAGQWQSPLLRHHQQCATNSVQVFTPAMVSGKVRRKLITATRQGAPPHCWVTYQSTLGANHWRHLSRQRRSGTTQSVEPGLVPVAGMAAAREGHTATPLANGQVLIAGGNNQRREPTLPALRCMTRRMAAGAVKAPMDTAQVMHTATLLPSGSAGHRALTECTTLTCCPVQPEWRHLKRFRAACTRLSMPTPPHC